MGTGASAQGDPADENTKMRFQLRREAAILAGDTTCANSLQEASSAVHPSELADRIDAFMTKHHLEKEFYDAEFMRALSCVLRVGLTVDPQLSASRYVKNYFTDLKQIGGVSVEGVATMTGMKGVPSVFVIKAPRNPGLDNLVHEYFVAAGGTFADDLGNPHTILGTNWLRRFCPSYAQILGAFRCGGPDIDPLNKRMRNWCSVEHPTSFVNYVVYEKIDGPDMHKLATTIDATTFVTSMIQLALALEIGQMHNGFTHYDLHYENAIMRNVNSDNPNEEALIPFVVSDTNTIYVESSKVLTIIDLGRCHIQSPSPAAEKRGEPTEHYGFHADFAAQYGILADKARPYYDLYKLLGFTLWAMINDKNQTFEQVWPIMSFFGEKLDSRDKVYNWAIQSMKTGNLFSLTAPTEKLGFCLVKDMADGTACLSEGAANMYDFLAFVEQRFNDIWKTKIYGVDGKQGKRVLTCGAECHNFRDSIRLFSEEGSESSPGNLVALGDFRNFMRFRDNLEHRGLYFQETYPQSTYGRKLMAEVALIDENIRQAYPQAEAGYSQQVLDRLVLAQQRFDEIVHDPNPAIDPQVKAQLDQLLGLPSEQAYDGIDTGPSTDLGIIGQELFIIKGYLDRMSEFAKAYAEFREFYDAAKSMTMIAGRPVNPEYETYIDNEIDAEFQAYVNLKARIRSVLEGTPIPKDYEKYKMDLLVRTI